MCCVIIINLLCASFRSLRIGSNCIATFNQSFAPMRLKDSSMCSDSSIIHVLPVSFASDITKLVISVSDSTPMLFTGSFEFSSKL